MLRNVIVLWICAVAGGLIPADAQTMLPPPPPGFKAIADSPSTTAMRDAGVMDLLEAEKPNDDWPGCIVDPKIAFKASWTKNPAAEQSVKMMLKMPEDPAAFSMGTKTEPAGKQPYKGGVLTWTKKTVVVAGTTSTKCPGNQVIMYDGSWVGYANGKLLGVAVSNLYGKKEAGQAWFDPYIDKLTVAVSNSK
jgi:hypothetical protein